MPSWAESLLGALIGGGLSVVGAWVAIGRQFKLQRRQTDEVARDFFSFLLDEQLRSVNSLINHRGLNSNQIGYFDLEKLRVNYSMFERNKEWLVRISDVDIRRQLIDAVSGLQLWTSVIMESDKNVNEVRRQLSQSEPGSPNHNDTLVQVQNAQAQLGASFASLSAVKQHLESVRASLN